MPTLSEPGADTEFALLLDQLAERRRRGEALNLDDCLADHPHLASTFRQLATVFELMPRNGAAVPELAGFRIVRELGRGGMGVVYEAVDDTLGRRVALKALPPQAAARPQWLERFQREARAAARLHHTNIVPVFGIGEQNGVHYFVMQSIDGVSLDRPPDADAAMIATWGLKIAEALAHAHSLGVLHRDIKPSNIILDKTGEPYLTDFGLAKMADDEDLTGTGDFIGTLRYSAPEQLRNQYDERGDVYSLGATLYELLARRPPFAATDRGELVRQIAEAEPAPLRDIPRDLDTVVRKAMAKGPAQRYESATALAADLRRYLAGESVLARPVSAFERTARWAKRHPAIAGLSATVAALLVAVAGVSVVGYVRTSKALETAEKAKFAESEERQRAERGEQDARQALAQTLLAINKAHAIVDAMPSGEMSLVIQASAAGATISRRKYEPLLATIERLVDLYEEFLRSPATDPTVRLEQSRAWRRLAYLYSGLNRHPEAEQAYANAYKTAIELHKTDPGSYPLRREVAIARGYRGLYFWGLYRNETILNAALADLAILATEMPGDSIPWSERCQLAARCAHHRLEGPERLHWETQALAFQREAVARSDSAVERNRLNIAYESLFLNHANIGRCAEARSLLLEWSAHWPEWPVHVLRMALVAGESLEKIQKFSKDADEIERWKRIAFDHLDRYARLGGTQNENVSIIAGFPLLAQDSRLKPLLAKIPPEKPAPKSKPK